MEDWELMQDAKILSKISEDNIVASMAFEDATENSSSFMVIHTFVDKESQRRKATLVSLTDPDWEEEIDVDELSEINNEKMVFNIGGLYQFTIDENDETVYISESYYNKTEKQRFENVQDYIKFFLDLDCYKQTEEDAMGINAGLIQGVYCLCQICNNMDFKKSPMAKNGKTVAKNLIDNDVKDLKRIMFREKQDQRFFYDLSIKTVDCLENVNNYYSRNNTKFVDASNINYNTFDTKTLGR